ncbi:Methionine--tRNA ligase, cytoplasmic [Mizuhopecten yessoensis]|uniref:Methionine--tRNA ligase, cytoplasmic n=2 Tax=Mizuhopecten yessoensis TaxID=6573 RepID=A0A210PVW4_MIZYE|nr:Methionine--tRNA ligase, cytoplasmic [Mizuhopecten yessoensis]
MKLHTNPWNFNSLKLLAAAELSGIKLEVVERKHDDKVVPYLTRNTLPVLEVFPNKFLFSVGAATRYLLNQQSLSPEDDSTVDRWLEWDSNQLQPSLVPYLVSVIGQNKPDAFLLSQIQTLLKLLNTELKGRQTLTKTGITAGDITLWGSLYPIFKPGKASIKGWEGLYPNIKAWFCRVEEEPAVQKSISVVVGGKDTGVFKDSLLAQPVPLSPPTPSSLKPDKVVADSNKKQQSKGKPEKMEADPAESQILAARPVTPEELAAAVKAWNSGKGSSPKVRERVHPVLPKDGERNIMITSALPYVNNVPHLGNIIGCVLSADVYSRYCRLRNYNVFYLCGTDEYGTATETKAIEEGLTPQQICDKYNKIHSDIYEWFNIDFDYFGRTTTTQQTKIAQDIFWKLYNQGHILKDSMEQLQCVKCNRFLADRFVEGTCPLCNFDDARGDQCDACGKLINATELKSPKCKLCKSTPIVKTSDHLFLDLPKMEPFLQKHLDSAYSTGTWSNNAKNITNSWIRDGLKPRCISRDLKWGTQVPLEGYTDKVFYVWFDAPIGYISITANYTDQWEKWWKNPKQVEMYNFLGKDNVPFHSVIFPCTLLGADDNYTIVNHMVATEYLNYEDGKFSKSRGTGVFGNNARDTGIPADIYRFYLLYVRPETQDSSFSWDDFLLKNNSELLNNLGNFINRALMFVSNNFDGTIQEMILTDDDNQLLVQVTRELRTYIENMEQAKIRDSIRNILSISRLGNQFMQANQPWVLVKGSDADKKRAGSVVSLAANISTLLSVLLQPYMPATSETIQKQLNCPKEANVVHPEFLCHLPPGHKIGQPSPLFEKIAASKMDDLKKKFAGEPAPEKKETKSSKRTGGDAAAAASGPCDPVEVARLTDEVAKQGLVVRDLKTKKADKSEIDAQVAKLLDLKKRLALAQGQNSVPAAGGNKKKDKKSAKQPASGQGSAPPASVAPPASSNAPGSSAEVDRLTEEVSKQGIMVRDLKSKKAEKSQIDGEVAKLLDLKKQLALAQGQDPNAAVGGGKKKGKKK